YQGAATGVGGIVRDILTMGARPVAVMDSLRFGRADAPDTARVLPGVVAGVGGYGNCLGLPNIGGEPLFDDCYAGNPLGNPLRDSTLTPAEILMSESQERMCAIVEPGKVEQFLAVCRKWDVLATVIGEVTDGDRLTVDWHGERIVDVPPRTVAHEGPVYDRPMARPADLDTLQADDPAALARPVTGPEIQAHWLA